MVKIKKYKNSKEDILPIENTKAINETISRSEEFISKHKSGILYFLSLITVLVVSFSIYSYVKNNQNLTAQEEMFQAVYYFEKDSLVQALNGDGNNYGFLEIIDEYSLSEAANLANYYAGASYLKLGNYENAIKYLKDFSSSDYLVQARAFSLIGDAYVELKDYSNAIDYFDKAADEYPNEYFTPSYLLKLALVYEEIDDLDAALEVYEQIIDKYKNSPEFQTSVKNKSRLEGLLLWVFTHLILMIILK